MPYLLFRHIPRLLAGLFLLQAATVLAAPLQLGRDIPYSSMAETDRALSVDDAAQILRQLPADERSGFTRGYVPTTFWLRFELPATVFDGQQRWLELGPNFVDDIRLYYRPSDNFQAWTMRRTGDLMQARSDMDYRNPILILPPPGTDGYEMLIRIQSSSTTLLQANFWQPAELFNHATRTTSFWSFYFGLTAISSLLALVLALVLGGRLLWSVTAFSVSYIFVASVQGYIHWLLPGHGALLQHYLTSTLTLVSYAVLVWLSAETINLRHNLPRAYQAAISASLLIAAQLVWIPFDRYDLAIQFQTVIYLLAVLLIVASVFVIWVRDSFRPAILLLAASPLVCTLASLFGMFTAMGWVPYHNEVYVVWQYALMVNMLLVMAIAVYRIREKSLVEQDKKQLATELKAERDASFHQRQFMGMVSHEFRTPLAVISGSLENLRYLDPTQIAGLQARYDKIQRATERLIQLTDNCLADARLAADNFYLDPQPTDLFELVRSAASLVQLSDNHQLALTFAGKTADKQLESDYRHSVDRALLRIALSSVIDNAVKYSSGGCIRIDCRIEPERATVTVCDQGSGIDPHDREHIFERYRRGSHVSRGSGLGLYIARQIARAHGGDLNLTRSSLEGSCFEFTLGPGLEVPDNP